MTQEKTMQYEREDHYIPGVYIRRAIGESALDVVQHDEQQLRDNQNRCATYGSLVTVAYEDGNEAVYEIVERVGEEQPRNANAEQVVATSPLGVRLLGSRACVHIAYAWHGGVQHGVVRSVEDSATPQ